MFFHKNLPSVINIATITITINFMTTITEDEFRAALSRFASGVTVVTTKDKEGRVYGITVSAFCSVSLVPPLVLICVEKQTASHYAIKENEFFVVNVLREDQQHLSEQFASRLPDRFDGIEFLENSNGSPILKDALGNLECHLIYSYNAGDHTIFVGEVKKSHIADGNPLIYFRGSYRNLGD